MSLIDKVKNITCENCRFTCVDNSDCEVLKDINKAFDESKGVIVKRSVFTFGAYQLDVRYVLEELGD